MTTFIFTQTINSVKNTIDNLKQTINSTPIGQYINYTQNETTKKDDKLTGKLAELSIQTSSYNKIIPIIYGTNRIAGNIIWLGNIKETYNTNATTIKIGKGQKIKQSSIEYFYNLSFAVAICKGEIEKINNVWADTKLLDLKQYKYRFYSGSSDQLPDSLIEAIEGIGNVPAYRDLCYIVFENFPLSEFNNRIPNFIFEVSRKNIQEMDNNLLEYCIKGINLLPCCGETILNTKVQYRAEEQFAEYAIDWVDGIWTVLNQNNNDKIADALYSLNHLTSELKNCEYFIQHIPIFGDNINIKDCSLKPRVEFNVFTGQTYNYGYPIYTRPDRFKVGNKWNRYNTPLLSKDSTGKFRLFGGSIGDTGILSFFEELKNRGKKSIFCPEILLDIKNTPSYKTLTGSADEITDFFTKENGYNEFILHYVELLKDYVYAFIIGNELSNLTSIQDENGNFPAVDNLVNLAQQVKEIVGDNVKVGYSAGYKEYHSNNYWYNLDKLWSSEYIDFVGIKAFFPLTNSLQTEITKETIKQGWINGEGYDYITENGIQIPIEQKYAYKNIEYWWKNIHINPDGRQTDWVPKSKKIWFTEYGFRSIDCATNEPFKGIGESPKYSTGNSNFYAQKIAIEATEECFKNSSYVEHLFAYYWDLRPYPFFPNKTDIWKDGVNWQYDYCLNGKTGLSNAKVSINQLFSDANIDTKFIKNIEVDEFIDGFVINNSMSIKDVLNTLQKVYFFDCVENDGKIAFISNKTNIRDKNNITTIYENELLEINKEQFINVDVISNTELPQRIDLVFLDKNNDYDAKSLYAERNNTDSEKRYIETLPVVLDENRARNIVETLLYSTWLEKSIFTFILPLKYIYLEPADIVNLQLKNNTYILKINTVKLIDNKIVITATIFDNTLYDYQNNITLNNNLEIFQESGRTHIEIIEIPAINQDMINKINVFFLIKNELKNWQGAYLYFSNNNQKSYTILNETKTLSTIGSVLNTSHNVKPYYFDYKNKLKVTFNNKIDTDLLLNIGNYELFNGVNLAIYGNEIIQFKNIVLNEDGTYTVSDLLRGLFDTENEISNHKEYDRFIILNDSILRQEFNYDKIDFNYSYKAVSIGNDMNSAENIIYTLKGINLKPFKPCHLRYEKFDTYVHFEWSEKGRGYVNWASNRDYMSAENIEKYYLKIIKDNKTIYSTYLNNIRSFDYYFKNIEFPFTIRLHQVNDLYGFGNYIEKIIE